MKLQLVDYQTAKDLKELGFNWKVRYFWDENSPKLTPYGYNYEDNYNDDIIFESKNYYSAPEQALVTKWFRDIYGLSIETVRLPKGYETCVTRINDEYLDVVIGGSKFNTWPIYEEAVLEGIKKTINYIKDEMAKSTTTS